MAWVKGWFKRDGWDGDRTVEEQLEGLDAIGTEFIGAKVLDLGCAEGMIGLHCAKTWGAVNVHGYTIIEQEAAKGRELCAGWPVRIEVADLREPWPQSMSEGYHIVLALSIVHKMTDPVAFLHKAAERANKWLAIRLPSRVHRDQRSCFVEIDPVTELTDFTLVAEPTTCRGEWLGIFKRI